jgi:hypothetical protein
MYAFQNEPATAPRVSTQVRGVGETDGWTLCPVRQAVQPRQCLARRSTEGAAGKQAGKQRCGRVNAEKLRATVTPKFTVRSEGPAPYRMLTVAKHEQAQLGVKALIVLARTSPPG